MTDTGALMDEYIRRVAGRAPEPPPAPLSGAPAPPAGDAAALIAELTRGWAATPADVAALLGDVGGTDLRDAVAALAKAKPYLRDGEPGPRWGSVDQGRHGPDRRDGREPLTMDEIIRAAAGRDY